MSGDGQNVYQPLAAEAKYAVGNVRPYLLAADSTGEEVCRLGTKTQDKGVRKHKLRPLRAETNVLFPAFIAAIKQNPDLEVLLLTPKKFQRKVERRTPTKL